VRHHRDEHFHLLGIESGHERVTSNIGAMRQR